jgi:hypothetical protein
MEDTREIEIGGPSGMGASLATLSSDELLDPPITQVAENETNSESDDDDDEDEVILSTYPPLCPSPYNYIHPDHTYFNTILYS